LADQGHQIIITTHSPVFAGSSPVEDLALIVRERGKSKAIQLQELNLYDVACELGVEPSDQIMGYNACVFVEGSDDVFFWKSIATKFKADGVFNVDFEDKRIGLIPVGGDKLKCWMNIVALQKLTRRFALVVDSDKKSPNEAVKQRKLNWKTKCENAGGVFICTRKREVENYLHRNAIRRSSRQLRSRAPQVIIFC
jgi:predicted ATP-dependent endonuclease of OLD family